MALYLLYSAAQLLVFFIPRRFSYKLASFLADLKYAISPKDRKVVIDNLSVVLGKDNPDISLCARRVFRNFGKYLVDFLRLSKFRDEYATTLVSVKGLKHWDEAVKRGKGVIALSAHIGNWELAGAMTTFFDYPLHAVALDHNDPLVNNFFIKQRIKVGEKVIPVGPSLKRCFKVLKENELLGLLGDRDFSNSGIAINFFGKKAILPKGPAFFAVKMDVALVPVFLIRKPDDTFEYTVEEPITCTEHSQDEERDVQGVMNKYVAIIEKYIRRYPDQWSQFREVWKEES